MRLVAAESERPLCASTFSELSILVMERQWRKRSFRVARTAIGAEDGQVGKSHSQGYGN